jgi:transposase
VRNGAISLFFVQVGMNKIANSKQEQVMLHQHTIDDQCFSEKGSTQGILVPLDLAGFQMMSQSLQADGSIEVQVKATTDREACPTCKQMCVKIHDTRERVKRDISLRGYRVRLLLSKRRFRCLACQRTFTETDAICGRYRRTTKRFREHLATQACQQTIAQVAEQAEVGPRFVQDCFESLVEDHLAQEGRSVKETAPLPTPCFLGIDEFARRKGHHYETILCDLVNRTVVEISEGRKLEEVQRLLERLDDPDAVQAVSMDMSASFRPAVQLCLPKARIVVDHFHVIQHVMKAFKKIVSSWAQKKEGKPLLQGKQHLFLTAKEDLTKDQVQERSTIGTALPLLEEAWTLKEALRTWYATATAVTAANELDAWIAQVQSSGFEPLRKALSAFVNWRQEILAFFHFFPRCISNGFVEGKNNRTKALMRQAYGYRNRHHLRLRILWGNFL